MWFKMTKRFPDSLLSSVVSVHDGMGIRITGNEKIRPDRGEFTALLNKLCVQEQYCGWKMWQSSSGQGTGSRIMLVYEGWMDGKNLEHNLNLSVAAAFKI